jgi:hypothetical protein
MYRKLLSADLLGDQKDTQKHTLPSLIEPGVTLVPHLLDSNDFARLLISVWDKKRRVMKAADKVIKCFFLKKMLIKTERITLFFTEII